MRLQLEHPPRDESFYTQLSFNVLLSVTIKITNMQKLSLLSLLSSHASISSLSLFTLRHVKGRISLPAR